MTADSKTIDQLQGMGEEGSLMGPDILQMRDVLVTLLHEHDELNSRLEQLEMEWYAEH